MRFKPACLVFEDDVLGRVCNWWQFCRTAARVDIDDHIANAFVIRVHEQTLVLQWFLATEVFVGCGNDFLRFKRIAAVHKTNF